MTFATPSCCRYARAQYELGRFHEFGLGGLPKEPEV